jgi:L-methionine (R)-S-oxide reductase
MAETLSIPTNVSRKEIYEALLPQLRALVSGEPNLVANTANIMAALKEALNFFWVGCYFVVNENELVLGPFQGPIACTRIKKGKGVCGTAWLENKTILVPDVDAFPGHIACSSLSKSEIVIPLRKKNDNSVWGVLDVDSSQFNDFSSIDAEYLEQIGVLISTCFGE